MAKDKIQDEPEAPEADAPEPDGEPEPEAPALWDPEHELNPDVYHVHG